MLLFCAIGVVIILSIAYAFWISMQMGDDVDMTVPRLLVTADVDTQGYVAQGYTTTENDEPQPQRIMVYVSGEVHNPGVFEFYEGARIVEAIEAAGGMTANADINAINPSQRMVDEQHIMVFNIEDNMPPTVTASGQIGQSVDGRININTATSEQLQTLSGIGPVTAGNIINHREARGGFATIEEIMNVSGIGERTFENIRDGITVD
ncbi:MAG: helix-hairpin-helix domain-containing protein [Defluviitaleaceae bacterium]|nr:helix-hairpin-helix domain-containing protein [Defluviitaleaceae bacterium]